MTVRTSKAFPLGFTRGFAFLGLAVGVAAAGCSDDAPIRFPSDGGTAGNGAAQADAGDPGAAGSSEGGTRAVAGASSAGNGATGAIDQGGGGGVPPDGPECGDEITEGAEECDDGNALSGDGCSSTCVSACETCERDACPDFTGDDYYNLAFFDPLNGGNATVGPAAGEPKPELTAALLDCVHASDCMVEQAGQLGGSMLRCYCANPDFGDCLSPATFMPGPCQSQAEEAAESTDPRVVAERFGSLLFAVGFANAIAEKCDFPYCRAECLPREPARAGCPSLPTILPTVAITPSLAAGAVMNLTARVQDDLGETLTVAWSATSGSFGTPETTLGAGTEAVTAATTYQCGATGSQTLTVTVSNGTCTRPASRELDCRGSGGTGGTGGAGGTAGTGGTGGTGPSSCGDGAIGPGEECEPPMRTFCSDDCQRVASNECATCEEAGDCVEFVLPNPANPNLFCTTVGGIAPNGKARSTNCYDVLECVRDSGCGKTNSVTECYCGTLPTELCVAAPIGGAGAPNGACKEELEAALEADSPQQVLARFTDQAYAGGWAMSRVTCDKTLCFAECFP